MKLWCQFLSIAVLLTGLSLFTGVSAFAQENEQESVEEEADPDMLAACQADAEADPLSVANACTWVIENGAVSGQDLATAHNNRGNAYLATRRVREALADFSRAIELSPDFALAYNNRANTHLAMGRFDDAFADFQEAVRLNPFDANTYFNRGNAYLDVGNFEEALNNFDGALRLDPENPRFHYNRGLTNLYAGDYEGAVGDFTRTIELDPTQSNSYTNRGNAHLSLDRVQEALADYDHAVEINPGDAYAFTNRGNLYRTLGREEDALSDFDMAIRISPMFAYALSSRGEAHRTAERYVDAIADFRVALRATPADPFLHNALAWIFATGPEELRNGEQAVEHARIAVAEAEGPDTLDTLAAALVEAGEREEALQRYEEVMAYSEENVRLYQKFLKEAGYYRGTVDGIMGRGTRRAFEACIRAGCQPMR